MSGLTVFFRDFLPAEEENDYQKSVSHVHRENSDDDDGHQIMTATSECFCYDDEEMDWNEWRTKRNDLLYTFMENRILGGPVCHEGLGGAKEEEEQGEEDQDEETEDDDAMLETQMMVSVDGTEDSQEQQTGAAETQDDLYQRVPHINNTRHVVHYLSDIDLYTKSLSLQTCLVTKAWPWRDGKRFAARFAIVRQQPIYTSTPQLPRVALQYCQDDGPLATCYRSVLSLEVRQVKNASNSQSSDLRERAEQMQDVPTAKRLKIFFYKTYAKACKTILASWQDANKDKGSQLFISLQNIPAKCIIPYSAVDWYDQQDQSDCCVCIGDYSLMRVMVDENTNDDIRARFDEPDIRVYLGFSTTTDGKSETVREWVLKPDENKGALVEELKDEETGPIQEYYSILGKQKEEARSHDTERASEETAGGGAEVIGGKPKRDRRSHQAPQAEPDVEIVVENEKKKQKPSEEKPSADHSSGKSSESATVDRSGAEQKDGEKGVSEAMEAPAPTSRDVTADSSRAAAASDLGVQPNQNETENKPAASPRRRHEVLSYEKLNNLRSIYETHKSIAEQQGTGIPKTECIVHLYGAVLGFSPPSRTKTGDWMIKVALVDDTLPLATEEGRDVEFVDTVNINIFAKKKEMLPDIRFAGDVLRLHRVKLQEWQGDIQLISKRASSYVVSRGKVNDLAGTNSFDQDCYMKATAKKEYTLAESEKTRFLELWKWAQKRLFSHPTMRLSQRFHLGDMMQQDSTQMEHHGDSNAHGDLTVMVAAVIPVPPGQTSGISPCGYLRVWDGTGLPASDPLPLATTVASDAVRNGDPPSEALVKIASIIDKLRFIRQNTDLQPPKALSGRVANAAIWEESHWEVVRQSVTVGSFIRLRNVQDSWMHDTGLRCLMVYSKSYLTPLPNLTYEVVHLLEEHNSRLLRNEPLNPQSGILPLERDSSHPTARNVEDAAVQNRRQAQQTSESAVADSNIEYDRIEAFVAAPISSLFSGAVRITALLPPLSAISSAGMDRICVAGANDTRVYQFAVRLQDESAAAVEAIVSDNSSAGEMILGMSASDALNDASGALFNAHKTLNDNRLWNAKMRSVAWRGGKYFLLESLQ